MEGVAFPRSAIFIDTGSGVGEGGVISNGCNDGGGGGAGAMGDSELGCILRSDIRGEIEEKLDGSCEGRSLNGDAVGVISARLESGGEHKEEGIVCIWADS